MISQWDYKDVNGNYMEDRFDPDFDPGADPAKEEKAKFKEALRLGEIALEMYAGSNKKYAFTGETLTIHDEHENADHLLHRIVALKDIEINENIKVTKGELGGFIESEENLSQEGNCWLDGDEHYMAVAYGNASVSDDAYVSWAGVSGNAKVCENAIVTGAEIMDDAVVAGNSKVGQEYGETVICGNAKVHGNAVVVDSKVGNDAVLCGDVKITNNYDYDFYEISLRSFQESVEYLYDKGYTYEDVNRIIKEEFNGKYQFSEKEKFTIKSESDRNIFLQCKKAVSDLCVCDGITNRKVSLMAREIENKKNKKLNKRDISSGKKQYLKKKHPRKAKSR